MHRVPILLLHLPIHADLSASARNLVASELSVVNGAIPEVYPASALLYTVFKLPFILIPVSTFCVEGSPAIVQIIPPLSLVLWSTVFEVENSDSINLILTPFAFVVGAISEVVPTLAMLQVASFFSVVLVSIGVVLCDF